MLNFLRNRTLSLSTVMLVLGISIFLQSSISYSTTFSRLGNFDTVFNFLSGVWIALRLLAFIAIVILWLVNKKLYLFRAIIILNAMLTFGLIGNMIALIDILLTLTSSQNVDLLLTDVLLMAISNILLFSVWYWVIDPPGVEPNHQHRQAWDFLFPQRASEIPHYENWVPRYTDYLALAFTTSFAFSPTDVLPLTRRAKMLMMLQATISIITLTGIAGSAINILAGRT